MGFLANIYCCEFLPLEHSFLDKNKIPGPAGIIFGEGHQKYKNNLLIFLQIAGPEAILIRRFYCTQKKFLLEGDMRPQDNSRYRYLWVYVYNVYYYY